MANIQQSVNQLLYQGQIGAGFLANSPQIQEQQKFKRAQFQEKNKETLKKEAFAGKQEALNETLGDATDEVGEKAWDALMDMGADIDVIEGFYEPKLTAGEKKLREMNPRYARQQQQQDIEIGKQKTIEYIQNILKQNKQQQGFKDVVFGEAPANDMTDRILQAINKQGTAAYNLDLIRKGGSK